MDNFGLIHAFVSAGIVNKLVFLLLIVISIYSWAIIFKKLSLLNNSEKELNEFSYIISSKNPNAMNTYLFSKDNVYSNIIELTINTITTNKIEQDNLRKDCEYMLNEITAKVEKDTNHLATISNSAPFIGLFGTVIGVINSFQQIGATASASLEVIAPGIAEALYATALGLFVAVPASIAYNVINTKIDTYVEKQSIVLEKIFHMVQRKV